MTYRQILECAISQSAIDSGCAAADFMSYENKAVISKNNENARKYLELPHILDLTSYGRSIVASVSEQYLGIAKDYINKYESCHCFETPNLHALGKALRPHGADICFMAEYWLPQPEKLKAESCGYKIKVLSPSDFEKLYLPQWSNALCEKRKQLDMIAVGAYDSDELIGLSGASADCDSMWQIGIDVLPQYRCRGIASCLTGRLASEIISLGKVPFYCCAWSNVASARNAVRSGFVPAWVQVTAKSLTFIDEMNK